MIYALNCRVDALLMRQTITISMIDAMLRGNLISRTIKKLKWKNDTNKKFIHRSFQSYFFWKYFSVLFICFSHIFSNLLVFMFADDCDLNNFAIQNFFFVDTKNFALSFYRFYGCLLRIFFP